MLKLTPEKNDDKDGKALHKLMSNGNLRNKLDAKPFKQRKKLWTLKPS